MAEPQIQYVKTSDGVSIAFWVMGDGPPLVLMPALSRHAQLDWQLPDMRRQYEWLAARHRLVRIDARNTGLSQRAVEDVSIEARQLDVEAVVDRLRLDEFVLYGGGTSGALAVAFAARHPLRVRRLILADAAVPFPDVPRPPALQALAALIDYDWETYTETLSGLVGGWSAGDETRENAALLRASITWEDTKRVLAAASDVSGLLPQVTAPTLVVHHTDAIVSTIETGRRLTEQIPGARLVALEGRAVASGFTDPRFMAAIDEFLAEDDDRLERAGTAPSGMAVVLFTDIVDSTALTERLGDKVFRTASRALDEGMRAAMREAGGTPVDGKVLGDGVMGVFTSASQAIAAARRCIELSAESELRLHVGLHAGDVIHEKGNVYGGAVNIAARICGLSAPGEVLVSATVRDLARTSAGVTFADRGEQALKGIDDAVRVYEVRWRE